MVYSVGFLDSLFGERVTVEIPNSSGLMVRRSCTKKWLRLVQAMEQTKMDAPLAKVHLLDNMNGYRLVQWVVGDDISETDFVRFKDNRTGDIYAIYYVEAEDAKIELIKRDAWELVYQKLQKL